MTWRPFHGGLGRNPYVATGNSHIWGGHQVVRVGPSLWAAIVMWPVWRRANRRKERVGIDTRGRVLGMFPAENQADACISAALLP